MNNLDLINKLFIFIGWWINYPPFFKSNLEKTFIKMPLIVKLTKMSFLLIWKD